MDWAHENKEYWDSMNRMWLNNILTNANLAFKLIRNTVSCECIVYMYQLHGNMRVWTAGMNGSGS